MREVQITTTQLPHLGAPVARPVTIPVLLCWFEVQSVKDISDLYLFPTKKYWVARIMTKSRKLPQASDAQFVSNHIVINNERTKRTIAPLKHNRPLDGIAREQATRMANGGSLLYAAPTVLEDKIGVITRIGANVGKGSNFKDIHKYMMKKSVSDKTNIIDRRFVSMGVGTAKSINGTLYMCQIFSDSIDRLRSTTVCCNEH